MKVGNGPSHAHARLSRTPLTHWAWSSELDKLETNTQPVTFPTVSLLLLLLPLLLSWDRRVDEWMDGYYVSMYLFHPPRLTLLNPSCFNARPRVSAI